MEEAEEVEQSPSARAGRALSLSQAANGGSSAKSAPSKGRAVHPHQQHGFPGEMVVSFSLDTARRQLRGQRGTHRTPPPPAQGGALSGVPSLSAGGAPTFGASLGAGGARSVPDAGSLERSTRVGVAEVEGQLARVLPKAAFQSMAVLGQFNLGFMIARAQRPRPGGEGGGSSDGGVSGASGGDAAGAGAGASTEADDAIDRGDLYIIDQHAADEKSRFEGLRSATELHTQRLIAPLPLHLTAADELAVIEHMDVFRANGLHIAVDEQAPPTQRLQLVALPFSKETVFGVSDVHELVTLVAEADGGAPTLPKLRAMYAMRACRSAVMIGTHLDEKKMTALVRKLARLEQPWNCPHGRPTLRHLVDLAQLATTECATAFERERRGCRRSVQDAGEPHLL